MSMPGNWKGFGQLSQRMASNFPGPGAASNIPMPSRPQPSDQTAAQRAMNLIPNQPNPQDVAGTLEHLTGRPADPAEVQQVLEDTQGTYGDYAPGGETSKSGPGNMQVR